MARRNVVYDMHDSAPALLEAKYGRSRLLRAALALAQRLAVRLASEVIVTNESQREIARRAAPRRVGRGSVVRNGPREREFGTPSAPRAGELRAPRLIYLGALGVQDGVLDLADLL